MPIEFLYGIALWPRRFPQGDHALLKVVESYVANCREPVTQIPTVLSLRQKNTSLWDYLTKPDLRKQFTQVILRMPMEQ